MVATRPPHRLVLQTTRRPRQPRGRRMDQLLWALLQITADRFPLRTTQPTHRHVGHAEIQTSPPIARQSPEATRPDRCQIPGHVHPLATRRTPGRLDNGSRVTRERHARFYERRRVKLPPPTHHTAKHHEHWALTQPAPGRFDWTSPLGHTYVTRQHHPQALARRPIPNPYDDEIPPF